MPLNKLDFLLEWYQKETERQNALNDALNIPIGALTAISALLFYMINEYKIDVSKVDTTTKLFLILTAVVIVLWVLAVYHLLMSYNKVYKGYTYEFLPYPSQLETQLNGLQVYIDQNRNDLPEGITAQQLYEDQLAEMLSKYLDVNIQNNDTKSAYIYNSKKYLTLCLCAVIMTFVPFGIHYLQKTPKDSSVNIYIKNISDLDKYIQNPKHMTTPQRPTPPPPPPPRRIKEGTQPLPPPPRITPPRLPNTGPNR